MEKPCGFSWWIGTVRSRCNLQMPEPLAVAGCDRRRSRLTAAGFRASSRPARSGPPAWPRRRAGSSARRRGRRRCRWPEPTLRPYRPGSAAVSECSRPPEWERSGPNSAAAGILPLRRRGLRGLDGRSASALRHGRSGILGLRRSAGLTAGSISGRRGRLSAGPAAAGAFPAGAAPAAGAAAGAAGGGGAAALRI